MARKSRTQKDASVPVETHKNKVWNVGLYRRLSVEADGDDENMHSIGNQQKIAEDFVLNDSSLCIKKIYTDNGISGMTFQRDGFMEMMHDLYAGDINCVMVKDISRLGRHFILTSEFVEKIFPSMNVRLICINDDYDSLDPLSDSEALLMQIKMVMNDNYCKDFSKKIRSSIDAKMGAGEFLPASGSIPYGYIRNPGKNTYDIDEEAAGVVREIFELRSQGWGFNEIARKLNEKGHPSPGRLRFERGLTKSEKFEKAVWVRGAIRKITNDPVYIGCRIHGKVKRDRLGENKKRRSQDEWKVIENAHEPIVSKELFDFVQKVNENALAERSSMQKKPDVEDDKRQLLRDKVVCGDCGSKMSGRKGISRSRKTGDYSSFVFFECNHYVDTAKLECKCHYIRQDDIVDALSNCLKKQLKVAVNYEELLEQVQSMPKVVSYQKGIKDSIASLKAKMTNLDAKKERMVEDFVAGTIDRKEYEFMKSRLEFQYGQLQHEWNQQQSASGELQRIDKSSRRWIEAIKQFDAVDTMDRTLLDILVERIVVYDKEHIKIKFAFSDPFQSLYDYLDKAGETRYAS